jgi:hypothetical protein
MNQARAHAEIVRLRRQVTDMGDPSATFVFAVDLDESAPTVKTARREIFPSGPVAYICAEMHGGVVEIEFRNVAAAWGMKLEVITQCLADTHAFREVFGVIPQPIHT